MHFKKSKHETRDEGKKYCTPPLQCVGKPLPYRDSRTSETVVNPMEILRSQVVSQQISNLQGMRYRGAFKRNGGGGGGSVGVDAVGGGNLNTRDVWDGHVLPRPRRNDLGNGGGAIRAREVDEQGMGSFGEKWCCSSNTSRVLTQGLLGPVFYESRQSSTFVGFPDFAATKIPRLGQDFITSESRSPQIGRPGWRLQ